MESQGRGPLSRYSGHGGRRAGPTSAPLYKRLPPGPHRLAPSDVVRHQRLRIHGAMIEAVTRDGYDGTSVKQIVALAGVSRRSFYEQFANKQACFLATFDLITERELRGIGGACRDCGEDRDERLGAALARLARDTSEDRGALELALVTAPCAGAAATQRLNRAIAAYGQMLARGLGSSSQPSALPAPIIAGIAGGLHGALAAALRDPQPIVRTKLSEAMLRWALPFAEPAGEQLGERMAKVFTRRVRECSRAGSAPPAHDAHARGDDVRRRVLRSTLSIAARHGYAHLSSAQIADESGISFEQLRDLFAAPEQCFLAALEMIREELLALLAESTLGASDWPAAVRGALAAVMCHLAERPTYAHAIAQEAFCAGPEAIACVLAINRSIATQLLACAPAAARERFAVEPVAGAFAHTLRSQVTAGRVELLPALADYLCFVVLTPSIGAATAGELLAGEPRSARWEPR
jgi:AcrR family transcriptional regulator